MNKIREKTRKFINATNKERVGYLIKLLDNSYISILPIIRIIKIPFVNSKERLNIRLDFMERFSNYGLPIRYRYYFGFKLFYSCSKYGTGIINHITCNRVYEKNTCDSLEKSLKNIAQPSFIDVGANVGLISLYLISKFPQLKVYAFEPSPHQYNLFKRTVEVNSISNRVDLFDLALSDKKGEASFFAHNEANCSGDGLIDTGRGGYGGTIKVKTVPLDIWWTEKGKPKINLIKIDTEGAELLVLKGAEQLLQQCSPDIFFEMQENNYRVYDYTWKDVLSFLKSAGYSVYTENGEYFEVSNAETLMKTNYNFIAKKC